MPLHNDLGLVRETHTESVRGRPSLHRAQVVVVNAQADSRVQGGNSAIILAGDTASESGAGTLNVVGKRKKAGDQHLSPHTKREKDGC